MPGEFLKLAIVIAVSSIIISLALLNSSRTIRSMAETSKLFSEKIKEKELLKYILENCFNSSVIIDANAVSYYSSNPEKLVECANSDHAYSLEVSEISTGTPEPEPADILLLIDSKGLKFGSAGETITKGVEKFKEMCTTEKDNITEVYFDHKRLDNAVKDSMEKNPDVMLVVTAATYHGPQMFVEYVDRLFNGGVKYYGSGGCGAGNEDCRTEVYIAFVRLKPSDKKPFGLIIIESAEMLAMSKIGDVQDVMSPESVAEYFCLSLGRNIVKEGRKPVKWEIGTMEGPPDSSVSTPVLLRNRTLLIPALATLNTYRDSTARLIKLADVVCSTGRSAVFEGDVEKISWESGKACYSRGCVVVGCRIEQEKTGGKMLLEKSGGKVIVK